MLGEQGGGRVQVEKVSARAASKPPLLGLVYFTCILLSRNECISFDEGASAMYTRLET